MSEETKNEAIETEQKECKCKECKEKLLKGLKEFTFKALIVYVGATLAIITSANLLKPKHPYHKYPPRPGIERQVPPGMYGHMGRHIKCKKHRQFQKVKKGHGEFRKMPNRPEGFKKPPVSPANIPGRPDIETKTGK